MADETREQLKQAYAYIQEERLDEAIAILRRVLRDNPDNADAWWLMANAVSEPADAAEALSNVLRLRPDYAEAREAYDQLIAEYPALAPEQPTEPAFDMSDFDIDDLLAQSPDAEPPSARPPQAEESFGVTAWSVLQAGDAQEADLDALFGGKARMDIPISPAEERDLKALFGAESTPPPPETPDLFEFDLEQFPPFDAGAESEPLPDFAEPAAEVDALFSEAAAPEQAQRVAESPPPAAQNLEAELDALFSSEPAFVGQIAQQEEEPRSRRKRRREEPTALEEAYGEPASEASAYAPPPAERHTNRRSLIRAAVGLLGIVAVILLVAVLVPVLMPDPVAQALRNAQQDLIASGFEGTAAERDGDLLRLTVCGSAGRALQNRVYEAIEIVAEHVAAVSDSVRAVQLTVTDCADSAVLLHRATAPIEAVRRYLEGGKTDVRAYRASWQQ
ncbi:MAG: tetratricopeptide repeat protein [Chloroflexi bacterium]|nr:tetratricopeptide repeat protein [Chloroflexota bacterium]